MFAKVIAVNLQRGRRENRSETQEADDKNRDGF